MPSLDRQIVRFRRHFRVHKDRTQLHPITTAERVQHPSAGRQGLTNLRPICILDEVTPAQAGQQFHPGATRRMSEGRSA